MRNAHDVGGQLAYGPVPRGEGPPFHADWERLAFGLTIGAIANGFLHNVDENRYAKERMRPQDFIACSYWELWLAAVELNLVENGVLTVEEVEAAAAAGAPETGPFTERPELTATLTAMLEGGFDLGGELEQPRRFALGDAVVVDPANTRNHSRVPAYAAGRTGTVDALLPAFPIPGVAAHGLGPDRAWCYRVRFEAAELWGAGAGKDAVCLDVWENDLRAPAGTTAVDDDKEGTA